MSYFLRMAMPYFIHVHIPGPILLVICCQLLAVSRRKSDTDQNFTFFHMTGYLWSLVQKFFSYYNVLCMYKMTWLKCILWGTRFPPTLCW